MLILCSRGVLARTRHLMKDFKDLLPHARSESKFDKSSKLADINEMAEMVHCTRAMYFENRKKRDSYLWLADVRGRVSAKFLILNIHTMQELRMTGNCLKGSRPLLSFDPQFDAEPHLQMVKEILKHVSSFVLISSHNSFAFRLSKPHSSSRRANRSSIMSSISPSHLTAESGFEISS